MGCPAFDTVNITVFQPIQTDVSPDRTICQKQSINLQATGSAASYIWTPAQNLSSTTISNPVASPMTTTQYRVVGYDGHNCFTDTAFVTITVNPTPDINLGPDVTLSTGTVYPLTSVFQNGPIVSWQWTPPANLNCITCPDPSATVKDDITYRVLITNTYGCTATDSINIKTFCEGSQVFVPNAFTPDGDGRNDVLMVRAKGIELVKSFRIFTRWGELIFEKTNFSPNDPAYGWDGKIKGVTGAAEVYVYTAEVICTNLQTYMFKGNTSILK
jgi:gliding motility-associated-like protein